MSAYQDWRGSFAKLLELHKPESIVEFGLGDGTPELLKSFPKVKSVEFWANRDWIDKLRKEITDTNWESAYYYYKTTVKFTPRLKKIVQNEAKGFEMAFVDPGVNCRADMVNALFNICPIIAAHDTGTGQVEYGWAKIEVPDTYTKVEVGGGQGTTFYILDKSLAEKML